MDLKTLKKRAFSAVPLLGGISSFVVFFLYGLANNLSMSYMGNTSERVSQFIMQNFLGEIILFLGKILGVYLVIALALALAVHLCVYSFSRLAGFSLRTGTAVLFNFIGTFILALLVFMRDVILYPQMYMNNFYVKNALFRKLVEALTDHLSPGVFTALLALFGIVTAGLLIALVIKLRSRRIVVAFAIAACVLAIAVLVGLISRGARTPASAAQNGRPNVLIIATDALRPDHLSGYGYRRDTSPAIDRLIAEGTSFTSAHIEVPRTFPSWVSILTGQFSATHGIRHMFPTSRDLNREFLALPRLLREKGYSTSVVADYAGDIFTRIDLGFERVDTPYFNFSYVLQQAIIENHPFLLPFLTGETGLRLFPVLRDSAYFCPPALLKNRIINAIDESGNRPFFAATFFSSTHFPYAPPYPYYRRYTAKDYKGPYRYYKQRIITLDEKGDKGSGMSVEDIEQVRALYDSGIRAMDDAVGEIISHLRETGRLDNTIVVVLSDHGENLYEREYGMGHGEHFRGYFATRIPLVIRYPKIGLARREIADVVRHVDIAPTILAIIGEKAPARMEGVSLLPLIEGKKLPPRCAFGETGIWFDNTVREDLFFQSKRILYPDITNISEIDFHFDTQIVLNDDYRDLVNFAKHRYVFDGRYKLIYMPLESRVEYELYDTKNDPEERRNIAAGDQANLARMKRILFDWVSRNGDVVLKNDFIFPKLRY